MPNQKKAWLAGCAALIAGMGASLPAHAADRAAQMQAHRGGTMRMVARSAAGTIDPQINYTLQYWQIYQALYDGLVAFKKAAGTAAFTIVPDLAESIPPPADDGRTYTFKLRQGVKFADGSDVTVKDVVASFQRIFKVSSPTSGSFYNGIVGADACLKSAADCTLKGGVVGDEKAGTVTFHLTEPDAEFMDKLAVPHASILPASTPAKDVGTDPVPGTGAYVIKSYDPNRRMTLMRNPHFRQWNVDAQPEGYVDEIDYDFGLTDEAEVTAVENGQADWMFDQPPTDRLGEIGTRFTKQVHLTPLTAMWYVPMNVNLPPFDKVEVRQAVNYAVDRKSVVNLFGGANLGTPACQILPPGFPGYEPYCPYTKNPGKKWTAPDLAKAKALIEQAGVKGQKVTIIAEDTAVSRAIGTYLESMLNEIGLDAGLKSLSPNIQFTYIQNTKNHVQISISQWYQDYPAASDFLNILFSCGAFHPGSDSSVNIAGFCDKEIDARMQAAMAKAVTDPAAANTMWAKIDKEVTDKAPAAILFNPKHVDFVSKRLGNFTFSSQFYWLIANSWVQ